MMKSIPTTDSIRLQMQNRLMSSGERMYHLPQAYVLSHTEIPEQFLEGEMTKWVEQTIERMRQEFSFNSHEPIFVRPCPVDEFYYPHLSFAGVYKSYKPTRGKNLSEHLYDGILRVLLGRYSKYADYYYHRHDINLKRHLSIMFTPQITDASMYGTAYVYKGKCIYELFDTPLAMYMNDPLRVADSGIKQGLEGRIAQCMIEAEQIIGVPVDIEFVLNRREQIYITQVRPISRAHLTQWAKLEDETWAMAVKVGTSSNVLNSIGQTEGVALDLRNRTLQPEDTELMERQICIINHKPGTGTCSEDVLYWLDKFKLSNIRLIVDHGDTRMNNHLQYIMMEDPGISFIVNTVSVPSILNGCALRVKCDGFNTQIIVD